MTIDLATFATEDYCYLTTTGRITGKPHTIEIWFGLDGQTVYLLSGNGHGADWVQNALREPQVQLRIRQSEWQAQARLITDPAEDALARELVVGKYTASNGELGAWGRSALPVAFDLNI